MMKQPITTLCMITVLVLLSQLATAQGEYLIKGEITGLDKEQTYVYLAPLEGENNHQKDSVKVVNGKFTFKSKVSEPNLFAVSVKDTPGSVLFVLENTAITLKGEAKEIWNSRITGSRLTDEFVDYQTKYSHPAREEMIRNSQLAIDLQAKGDSVKAQEYYALNAEIMNKQVTIAEEYIKEHPQSFYSLYLLNWGWE